MNETIKVVNNEARVHTIGCGYAVTAGGAGRTARTLRLLPGLNEVPADLWEKAKKLPVVAHYVKTQVFEEVHSKATGLAGLSMRDAIDTVNLTMDRELLKKWKNEESRDPVVSAIEVQIDHVTYRPDRDKPKDKDAEGFDLSPRPAQTGFDGADIANQVQSTDAPEALPENYERIAPQTSEAVDRSSKTPVEPPAALTKQLRDVSAPKVTPPVHGRKSGKSRGK